MTDDTDESKELIWRILRDNNYTEPIEFVTTGKVIYYKGVNWDESTKAYYSQTD